MENNQKETQNPTNIEDLKKGRFIVNTSAIIFDTKTKKILIGKRKDDPFIKDMTWCFPCGRPTKKDTLEQALKREVKIKTGLEIESLGPIFVRIVEYNPEFLSIFYLCEVTGGELKAGEKLVEVKWVNPEDLEKEFTTPLDPKLKEYIMGLKAQ
ncbi:MAG: NUDIX hydrolase [Nanoarchaeota archaeon]|nr:NUDIX hydrolase [Nanoarchaeota archaeon]